MKKITLLTAFAMSLISSASYAANSGTLSIAGLAGFGSASTTGSTNSGFSWGGNLRYSLDPNWSVGAEFNTLSSSTSITILGVTTTVTSNSSLLLGNVHYNFSGDLAALYLGVNAGITLTGTTNFAVGPTAGYDFNLGSGFSIGPKVSLTFVTGTATTTMFQGFGQVKYSFM